MRTARRSTGGVVISDSSRTPDKRQLQRARDRRRRQREDVHVLAQLLQALLVGDAEVLLLVDDEQAEAVEFDRLAEQRVRADDDIDRAALQALLHARQLLGADQARGLRDADRQALEALARRS